MWDRNVSSCLDGQIDLDGFIWLLNSCWGRVQNRVAHFFCSSFSDQGFGVQHPALTLRFLNGLQPWSDVHPLGPAVMQKDAAWLALSSAGL